VQQIYKLVEEPNAGAEQILVVERGIPSTFSAPSILIVFASQSWKSARVFFCAALFWFFGGDDTDQVRELRMIVKIVSRHECCADPFNASAKNLRVRRLPKLRAARSSRALMFCTRR